MHISKNIIELWGNLAKPVESSVTRSGVAVANLSVVVMNSWRDAEGIEHEESTFIPVECFGATAEWAAGALSAGDRIVVEGRLKNTSWGHGAEKKSKMLISAARILAIR